MCLPGPLLLRIEEEDDVQISRFAKATLWLAIAAPAFGQLTQLTQPTAAYTSSTALIPITVPDATAITSITNGTQTITLGSIVPSGSPFNARTVPSGGWSTWNTPPATESATPRVVATYSAVTSLTLTLSVPSATFGVEIEPDLLSTYTISAAFFNGGTLLGTISQNISGSAGALLAAASSTSPITSVVITAPAAASGFAMAQFRTGSTFLGASSVPTLQTTVTAGLGMLLAAAGVLLARLQQPNRLRP